MEQRRPRVLAVGDLMIEICFLVEDAWSKDPDIPVLEQTISCGGSAANFAACLAQLGQDVRLLSQVGTDDFGDHLLKDLAAYGVPHMGISRIDGPSSATAIIIGADGDRRFLSFRSPSELDYTAIDPQTILAECNWLHISGFVFQRPASASFARGLVDAARSANIPISIDPSPLFAAYVEWDPGLLTSLDYIFPNEYEARALTGFDDPVAAAADLRDRGVGTVIVTIGDKGCVLSGPLQLDEQLAPPTPTVVLDSTGAGDAFAAGFIAAIQAGRSPQSAAKLGMHVAAEVIAHIGGHTGAPSLDRLAVAYPDLMDVLEQLRTATATDERERQ